MRVGLLTSREHAITAIGLALQPLRMKDEPLATLGLLAILPLADAVCCKLDLKWARSTVGMSLPQLLRAHLPGRVLSEAADEAVGVDSGDRARHDSATILRPYL